MNIFQKWLSVAGLSFDLLGAILVGAEFIGISRVQKFFLSLKRFYPDFNSKSRKAIVVTATFCYIVFLCFVLFGGSIWKPFSQAIKLFGGVLTYFLISSGSVIWVYLVVIPWIVYLLGFIVEEFYKESQHKQVQVLGISGLILIFLGFSLQLAANLLT